MQLDKLGEFGLIDLVKIPSYAPEQVILSRGDDCAVLACNETQYQVLSCDLLVEDVHFIRSKITPQQLGYKAVAVNLSDVAAMGGKPVHILLSLALPPDYTVEEWQGFYEGVDEICRRYSVNVIGGDTTSSTDKLAINVTVLGLVEKEYLHLRSHAEAGDVVFVTGSLGGSRAGLELMRNDIPELEPVHRAELLQCHCKPEPCCEEIAVLNRLAGADIHALNDISDGLLSECREIAEASGMALIVQPDKVPVNKSCAALARLLQADSLQWALTGGEDYQLVGTMAPKRADAICAQYESETGRQLTIIGTVEAGSGVYVLRDGQRRPAEQRGYDHFGAENRGTAKEERNKEERNKEKVNKTETEHSAERFSPESLIEQQLVRLAEQEEQQRIYRHDLNNHLMCLSGLLQCGKTEQAMAYLQQMIDEVPQNTQTVYSSRTILNILLQQKEQQAQQAGLDVQFSVEDGLLDFISDYDLCTLLGNLLNNGIEHSHSVDDAWLYLDIIGGQNGEILIRMENSCARAPEVQHGSLATQKEQPELHGKGMAQIRRITAKYGGMFSWQYDEPQKRFTTQCKFAAE